MSEKPEPVRCLVPFCRGRSWKHREDSEYLCLRHYKLADPAWRAALRRSYTAYTKAERGGLDTSTALRRNFQAWQHIRWQVLVRTMEATELKDEEPVPAALGRIVRAPRHAPEF